jgi:hypothetical protein
MECDEGEASKEGNVMERVNEEPSVPHTEEEGEDGLKVRLE